MTTDVGRAATEALAHLVRARQQDDPLTKVTVIAPSHLAALSLRRGLGAEGRGVANVDVATLDTIIERLAAGVVDGPPLTPAVLGAAVRRALAESPGRFAPVAGHPATEDAAASLYAELAAVSVDARRALAATGGRAGHDAVMLFEAIDARHGRSLDVHRRADALLELDDLATRAAHLGRLIWFLPEPSGVRHLRLAGALLQHLPSAVVVGWCGDAQADAATAAACATAGVTVTPGGVDAPLAARVVSASDADDEVRAVLREVARLLDDGVPPWRIGVVHPAPDPYARILRQQLRAAGLPASGPAVQRPADSVAGRALLGALALPALDWRRDRVLAFLSDGPMLDGERLAPAATWELLSRRAGVVAGLGDWQHRLDGHRRAALRRVEWDGGDPATDDEVAECDRLQRFVVALAHDVESIRRADGWAGRASASITMLERLLGAAPTQWPDDERRSFDEVRAALGRLAELDRIDPDATADQFVRAVGVELDPPVGRDGRFGSGILHGHLSTVIGVDLDAVFVLGGIEGLLPHGRRDDALLPDRAREATRGELSTRAQRTAEQRRRYLSALGSAPADRRWVSLPRSDLRRNRATVASRWVLESAAALADRRVTSDELPTLRADGVLVVQSHAAGLAACDSPAGESERDTAALLRWQRAGLDVVDHPAVGGATRGISAQRARRSADFTEWDGHLHGAELPPRPGGTWSATELEAWAACGLRHYFQYVLGVRDRDDPDSVVDLQPLDRGALLHTILERFVGEAIAAGEPPATEPWSEQWRSRLIEIAEEEFATLERRGRTGRDLAWQITRADLVADLLDFLERDDAHRAEGWQAVAVEWSFGTSEVPPVVVDLGGGRQVSFGGRVDRVDRTPDGRTMVIDYKSGRSSRRGRTDDPVHAGTRLQLGIYARAAMQLLGGDDVSTMYWPVRAGDRSEPIRTWSADDLRRLDEVVRAGVDGIEAGVHPAEPGDWSIFRNTHEQCVHCPYDRVCPRDRGEHATAKSGAPALAVRHALRTEDPS